MATVPKRGERGGRQPEGANKEVKQRTLPGATDGNDVARREEQETDADDEDNVVERATGQH